MQNVVLLERSKEKKGLIERLKKNKRFIPFYIMMIPGLIYFVINNYLPMFGLVIAFKNFNYKLGILGSKFSGLDNFKYLFKTKDAFIITRNTMLYNIAFIVFGTLFSIILALVLNDIKNKLLSRFFQSVILLPYLISMVIVSYIAFGFLSAESGLLNNSILPMFHIKPISWYTEAKYWPIILFMISMWKSVGYTCVVYLAAIIGIDGEYYEAATLEGATKWQQIRHITLPLITPVITMMVLFAIGRIFYSDFGLFYQVPMNSGAIYNTTNVIDTYVYRGLMQLNDIGMSSAAGLYQSIVGFVLVLLSNLVVRKINPDNALF